MWLSTLVLYEIDSFYVSAKYHASVSWYFLIFRFQGQVQRMFLEHFVPLSANIFWFMNQTQKMFFAMSFQIAKVDMKCKSKQENATQIFRVINFYDVLGIYIFFKSKKDSFT